MQVGVLSLLIAVICSYKKSLSFLFIGPLKVLEGFSEASLKPSLPQAEQPQLSQPVCIGEVLQHCLVTV